MSKEVKVTKAKAFEIDPTKKYIIVFDKSEISMDDASKVNQTLHEWGAEGISIAVGDPQNVKVIEL